MENVWFCPLCNSQYDQHEFWARMASKFWKDGKYMPIAATYAICTRCGLVFLWDRQNEVQNEHYYMKGDYRNAVQGSPHITERVKKEQELRAEFLMPHLKIENVRKVLDIGASTGIWMKALEERYGCEVLGIEPSEHFRLQSKMKMFSEMAMLYSSEYYNAFDLITVIHTLEHLNDPKTFLVSLHEFITEEGHLLIEVPHLMQEHSLTISHPVCFTPDTLTLTLNMAGWEVVWMKEYFGFKEDDRTLPPNILTLAVPGKISEFIPKPDIDALTAQYKENMLILDEDFERFEMKMAKMKA